MTRQAAEKKRETVFHHNFAKNFGSKLSDFSENQNRVLPDFDFKFRQFKYMIKCRLIMTVTQ